MTASNDIELDGPEGRAILMRCSLPDAEAAKIYAHMGYSAEMIEKGMSSTPHHPGREMTEKTPSIEMAAALLRLCKKAASFEEKLANGHFPDEKISQVLMEVWDRERKAVKKL